MGFLKNIQDHQQSDKELADLYRETGNMELLGQLFQRYMDMMYGVCLKYLKDPETAKDAVMQLFEELGKKLSHHQVENVKSWIYTLAKNYCLMQLRSPRNFRTTEFNPEIMQSENETHLNGVLQKEENLQRLENCLQTLSGEQKTTVELFYLQNKCYKEISAETGIDWNKVRSHIQNGRRNLKLCMEKQAAIQTPEF
ncbi:sigma-70 family RNA polymerase sigma factor [Pseudoflavitalea sp. G-6-1-2]|uniref:sigma-70 family RNA polymerase sigma factor n=1 Tax=Pseudoflavitalea sp. G-6-1-2 TaxID=2728841 RepID=UPI00146A825C|nr:sigma-70 family RNA polymerase sigma factor [Pseudoflavitalea sp. G-6-1-2]